MVRPENADVRHEALRIRSGTVQLDADLELPAAARGLVLFAHGSGSSRFSPRNRHVAGQLQQASLATVLADLLTPEEEQVDERTRALRFDIALLARRLVDIADLLAVHPLTSGLPLGLFGASTGAGAALVAAAHRPAQVHAVVSRGGRPDLAGMALARVEAPVLLIVGGRDEMVIELNEQALVQLRSEKKLVVVPGATHLFQEPGTLEQVAELAAEWFVRHFVTRASHPSAS
jgi:pimeloyl-ACP methyl ester carboxylesterase